MAMFKDIRTINTLALLSCSNLDNVKLFSSVLQGVGSSPQREKWEPHRGKLVRSRKTM